MTEAKVEGWCNNPKCSRFSKFNDNIIFAQFTVECGRDCRNCPNFIIRRGDERL